MIFTSFEFLLLFLPISVVGYFLLPLRLGVRNYWLLLMSLGFYAWGEPKFVFVMMGSIIFNYLMAILISMAKQHGANARIPLGVAIAGNLIIIGVWKYANFITANIRNWFPLWKGVIPQTSILLPIGISFFTFQALSYVVDVYRSNVKVQRNPFHLALYIALFPQLVAGPIVRYSTVCREILSRKTAFDDFTSGIFRFVCGFNKKVLLANYLAVTADKAFAMESPDVGMAWLGAICYTFQIFFDFSGYSDMAIGLGRVFGFHFDENFKFPYISRTVTEFWRRWHISLGTWFRDYVYFPLGGSRVARLRMLVNLAVVWFLTGLWHGANWTFILWGGLFGILIMAEKFFDIPKRMVRTLTFIGWLYTFLFVVLGWVLFRSQDLYQAISYLKAMLGLGIGSTSYVTAFFEFQEIKMVLLAAVLFSTPLFTVLRNCRGEGLTKFRCFYVLGENMIQLMLFVVSCSCLAMNSHNPFIYFNF